MKCLITSEFVAEYNIDYKLIAFTFKCKVCKSLGKTYCLYPILYFENKVYQKMYNFKKKNNPFSFLCECGAKYLIYDKYSSSKNLITLKFTKV